MAVDSPSGGVSNPDGDRIKLVRRAAKNVRQLFAECGITLYGTGICFLEPGRLGVLCFVADPSDESLPTKDEETGLGIRV